MSAGVIATALVLAIGLISSLAANVLFARWLSVHDFGIYAFSIAILTLLTIPSQIGAPQLIVRESAKLHLRECWSKLKGFWEWSKDLTSMFSFAIMILSAGVVFCIDIFLDSPYTHALLVSVITVPVVVRINVLAACIKGLRRVPLGQAVEVLSRSLLVLLIIACVILLGLESSGPVEAMLIQFFAASLALSVAVYKFKSVSPLEVSDVRSELFDSDAVSWKRSSFPLAAVGIVGVLNSNLDVVVLGMLRSPQEVGLYKVAVAGAGLVVFGLQALNLYMSPRLSRLHYSEQKEELERSVVHMARLASVIALPGVLVFVVGGRQILEWIFGPEYVGAYIPLVILSIGQLVSSLFGPVGVLLNMTGNEKSTLFGLAVSVLVNVILGLVLVFPFGVVGVAVAASLSVLTWNLLLWFLCVKHLGVNASAFGSKK